MLQLGSFEQDRAMFGRRFALVRLPDNDAAAVYLHVLMLDDDFEFADLLFEFLHAPVQSRDLLGLNRHDLLRIFQFGGVGGRVLLALLRVEKRIVPARPLASRKFRMIESVSISVSYYYGIY